ncbi:MAG: right-handed parallel beta-helix repeat-containing protein [Candidatus Cloacimonadota bacterium]|nr:right-handed parallel beta-helix repeat-containing protein [Candidatus Cloacimonadota bacterium]
MRQIFTISFILFLTFVNATIINVPADQPTIQDGINEATNLDTVLVQPGIYLENVHISEKTLTISSLFLTTQDTSYISQTIIDGNHEGQVFSYYGMIDSTSVLCGFTITNGYSYNGGGINSFGSSTQFRNLIITENVANFYGGGMYLEWGSPLIENCIIKNNSAGFDGGALYLWKHSNAVLNNVQIFDNTSDQNGGGIYSTEYCDVIINNSTIFNNTSIEAGGGIYNNNYCNITLENVTIRNNSSSYGGGIYSSNIYSTLSFDPINRCSIYSNTSSNNTRGYGVDIFAYDCDVIVDTFTILIPTDYYASPIGNFNFDILHEIGNPLINADLFVSVNGDNSNSGISADEPLKTIQYALSKIFADSLNHNTIHLLPGVYSTTTNGEIFPIMWSNNVSLIGSTEEDTFVDAENINNVFTFNYVSDAHMQNMTIRNGSGYRGGGIYCTNSSPTLENLTISGNDAYSGGGISCYDYSNPTLLNVDIINNHSTQHGGGISCRKFSNPVLNNVNLLGNSTSGGGGGISCYIYSNPNLQNVNIIGNTATSDGGGIKCHLYSNPILQNVTIAENSSFSLGGGIACDLNSTPIFSNIDRCNIFLNLARKDGNDLFSEDPLFVIVDTFTVTQVDDYFASPVENFTFDILNYKIEQINQDIYVNPNGSDENSGISVDDPFKTISYALLKIFGDSLNTLTIHLSEGNFSSSQTGEVFPLSCRDNISICGEGQGITILDGENLSNLIYCSDDINFSIEDLTITNGNGDDGGGICLFDNSTPQLENLLITENHGQLGGGIYCNNSSPSLKNLEVINNQTDAGGGGICLQEDSNAILENISISNNTASNYGGLFCSSSDPILQNVVISNNSANSTSTGYGAGIGCVRSNITMLNTIIDNNSSEGNGAGIYCILYSELYMENVIITNNTSDGSGGGIYCDDQYDVYAKNITFADNYAHSSGGGIYVHNDYHTYLTLRNAIFWNNPPYDIGGSASVTIISYSNTNYGFGGPNNMWEDPLFIGTGEFPYALQEDSPCIDMGYPSAIYYDPEDPENPGYALYPARGTITNDMGAYGGPNAFAWNPVSVEDNSIVTPTRSQLYQNYPNPFNPTTTISFSVTQNSDFVTLSVYNIKGQKVKTLVKEIKDSGYYQAVWDGTDNNKKQVASGVYFYRLSTGEKTLNKKMLLLK